jgi:hypothetical protein
MIAEGLVPDSDVAIGFASYITQEYLVRQLEDDYKGDRGEV